MKKLFRQRSNAELKSLIVIVCCAIVLLLSVGGSMAFITTVTEAITNVFKKPNLSTEIVEDFDGEVKENVKFKNNGDTDEYIRAYIVVTYKDAEGNVYSEAPEVASEYYILMNNRDWKLGNDGFWYYPNVVEPGDFTPVLINECKMRTGVQPPEGYFLSVEILCSAIQAKPKSVAEQMWNTAAAGITLN